MQPEDVINSEDSAANVERLIRTKTLIFLHASDSSGWLSDLAMLRANIKIFFLLLLGM